MSVAAKGALIASTGGNFAVGSAGFFRAGAADAGLWTCSVGSGFGGGCAEEAWLADFGSQVSLSSSSLSHGGVDVCDENEFLIIVRPDDGACYRLCCLCPALKALVGSGSPASEAAPKQLPSAVLVKAPQAYSWVGNMWLLGPREHENCCGKL